ncbi:hypothetical protein BC567DRAFT_277728 [Phyllosticta citribraziliensis]
MDERRSVLTTPKLAMHPPPTCHDDVNPAVLTSLLQDVTKARARVRQARQQHDTTEGLISSTTQDLIKAKDTAAATDKEATNLQKAQVEVERIAQQSAAIEALRQIAAHNKLELDGVAEAVRTANDDVRVKSLAKTEAEAHLEEQKLVLRQEMQHLQQKEETVSRVASIDHLQTLASALGQYLEHERGGPPQKRSRI